MSDLLSPEVFTSVAPGKTVTATRLNNHVNGAVIQATFVTGKTATAPATTDKLLVSDTSAAGALISSTVAQILALQTVDGAAGVGTMRTLGTGAAQAAPGNDVRFTGYPVIFQIANSITPADSTTYYFGGIGFLPIAARTDWTTNSWPIRKTGVIKAVTVQLLQNTVGTSESATLTLKVNDSTNGGTNPNPSDTSLDTAVNFATGATKKLSYTGLSIAVAAGDYVALKLVTPAWATNPQINGSVTLWIEGS